MTSEKYLHTGTEHEIERERLDLLESILDPFTVSHLSAIGVTKGWKCLEVGGGGGSVARWLAQQVGTEGQVLATDLDPRFLRELDVPNLTICQHNIVSDDLEEGQYDLVHCRYLLLHVAEREKAIGRMAAAVRPGGWLLVEEPDFGLFGAANPQHPSAEFFNSLARTCWQLMLEAGVMDPFFGRRARALLEGLGFIEVRHDVFVWCFAGGEAGARFTEMNAQAIVRAMVPAGLVSEEQIAEVLRLYRDPSFSIVADATFSVWGQRAE